jgi:hypothetical protein
MFIISIFFLTRVLEFPSSRLYATSSFCLSTAGGKLDTNRSRRISLTPANRLCEFYFPLPRRVWRQSLHALNSKGIVVPDVQFTATHLVSFTPTQNDGVTLKRNDLSYPYKSSTEIRRRSRTLVVHPPTFFLFS